MEFQPMGTDRPRFGDICNLDKGAIFSSVLS